MANSTDPDQLASSDRSQLIWICTVHKGNVYPGSAGQELKGYREKTIKKKKKKKKKKTRGL